MALQADQIQDLITVTLKDLGRLKFVELASTLQEYHALGKLIDQYKVQYQSGTAIQWNIMLNQSGAAKNVGLFESDNVNISDVMTTASIPWRHCTTNYAFERREVQFNATPARIVELVKIRRADAMISLAELMEKNFWQAPATTSDTAHPYGLAYQIVRGQPNDEGFTGKRPFAQDGTQFADHSGLDPDLSANAQWRNYFADYETVSKTDLVRKWRKASVFTNFKPVPQVAVADYNTGNNYAYYTNYNVIGRLEEALEAQNDNLGNDIASKDGQLVFRQVPVMWVPHLETDTTNGEDPIYGVNWGTIKPVFLSGEYMREEGPTQVPGQHTTFQVFVDSTLNFKCTDRRRNFLLSKVS